MKTTILTPPKTLAECEPIILEHKDKGTLFDLGDGIIGKIKDIKYFNLVDGIDTVIFEPVRNDRYYEDRRKLGDDWVIDTQDWLKYIFGLNY